MIAVVQTTSSPFIAGRIAARTHGRGYPVLIRSIRDGQQIDHVIIVRSVKPALQAAIDWREVERIAVAEAEVVISTSGDQGLGLFLADGPATAIAAADYLGLFFQPRHCAAMQEHSHA